MAAHKHVLVEDACSRCGGHGARDVEIFVGSRDFAELRVGDTISWSRSPQIQNGGRPSTGDSGLARGLSDCTLCNALLPYEVHVRASTVVGVRQCQVDSASLQRWLEPGWVQEWPNSRR